MALFLLGDQAMKKIFRISLLLFLCLAFIFPAGCSTDNIENGEGVLGQNQAGITFIPQEVQPIEENPPMVVMEISSESELHRLDVQRPVMEEIGSSDDMINTILDSADQKVKLQNQDLLNSSYLETGNQQVNKTLSDQGEYLEMVVQRTDIAQDDGNQGGAWGQIGFDISGSNAFSAAEMGDNPNSAFLFKYRYHTLLGGFQTSIYNGSATIHTGLGADNNLFVDSEQDFMRYSTDSKGEYLNSINFLNDEWYFTLAAMDRDYGFRYITWQENDPSNHAFYACDLSGIFKPYHFNHEQGFWAGLDFFTDSNAIDVDVESLTIYGFENFNDVENVNLNDDPEVYTYADDDEKYQLAAQLFEAGDYYNTYKLFQELDGYDTGDYLAECERLLKTIEVKNPNVAGIIKKALKDHGIPVTEYLYVYQAEELESLDLSECRIEDLSFISNFTNLKELNLNKNAISDLTPLKDLYALERLSLAENNISDTLPLYNLTNLQYLDLNDNLLEDMWGLSNLTSLQELNLSTNNIYSLDGLNHLEHLESVDLSYNYIYAVSALENSPIKELNIMNTNIDDLGAVANLPELEALSAGFRYIWKGNEGYLLTRKYEMDHHFFLGITGLEALAGHNNLKYLNISRLEATNGTLEPLTTIPNLESLIFHHYTGQADPESLGKLVNLKELTLDSFLYGFGDTSFLANLTKLEKLSIETFCTVNDLSLISGLSNLEELRMYKYGDDLSFLTGLEKLRLLELINWDTVDDYSPLLALDNLEHLALQEMTVNDLSVFAQLENLNYLRLDSPEINNIKDVGQMENLECFIMGNSGVIGDSQPEFFDRSLFDGLDHLRYAFVGIRGEDGFGYEIGDPEFRETIEEPQDIGIEYPEYEYYWIDNPDALNHLPEYIGSHHLIIDGYYSSLGENVKFTIPKNIRALYILSYDDQPIKIELDGADNKGLERIVVGHIDFSPDDPDGFGQGNFIIENLDGLSDCTNLKEIYINAAKVNDISGLAGCDKLEIVELENNNISDISALADKKYLRELSLSGNNIKSVETLNNCLRLQSLSMQGNPVGNYDSIEHLPLLNW